MQCSVSHLVVVWNDRWHLPAGERDVLARQLVDSPGSGVECMVECKGTAVTPVPVLECVRTFSGQHLLIDCLTIPTQAHCKLWARKRIRQGAEGWTHTGVRRGKNSILLLEQSKVKNTKVKDIIKSHRKHTQTLKVVVVIIIIIATIITSTAIIIVV